MLPGWPLGKRSISQIWVAERKRLAGGELGIEGVEGAVEVDGVAAVRGACEVVAGVEWFVDVNVGELEGEEFGGFHDGAEAGVPFDVGEGLDLVVHVDFAGGGEGLADGVGFDDGHPEEVGEEVVGRAGAAWVCRVIGARVKEEGLPRAVALDAGGEGAEHHG